MCEKENLQLQLSKQSSNAEQVIDQVTKKYQELKEENDRLRLQSAVEDSQSGGDDSTLQEQVNDLDYTLLIIFLQAVVIIETRE